MFGISPVTYTGLSRLGSESARLQAFPSLTARSNYIHREACRDSWLLPATCVEVGPGTFSNPVNASSLRKASLPLNLPNRNEGVFICITKGFSLFLKIGSPSPLYKRVLVNGEFDLHNFAGKKKKNT